MSLTACQTPGYCSIELRRLVLENWNERMRSGPKRFLLYWSAVDEIWLLCPPNSENFRFLNLENYTIRGLRSLLIVGISDRSTYWLICLASVKTIAARIVLSKVLWIRLCILCQSVQKSGTCFPHEIEIWTLSGVGIPIFLATQNLAFFFIKFFRLNNLCVVANSTTL